MQTCKSYIFLLSWVFVLSSSLLELVFSKFCISFIMCDLLQCHNKLYLFPSALKVLGEDGGFLNLSKIICFPSFVTFWYKNVCLYVLILTQGNIAVFRSLNVVLLKLWNLFKNLVVLFQECLFVRSGYCLTKLVLGVSIHLYLALFCDSSC